MVRLKWSNYLVGRLNILRDHFLAKDLVLNFQNEFDQLLGKKVLCRSVNTSAQKSIVGTKKKINSKPEKVQTTVTSAPRHTSLPKQTSPNKSSSSTKSTMNKTGQKRQ